MRLAHFLRMANWARNPPSTARVILVFSVIGLCLLLALVEWLGILPDGFGIRPGPTAPKIQPLP